MQRGNRGIALASTILISVILLILGVSFLFFLERDYRFAGQQSRSQEAYYLALAGLQYARSRPDLVGPGKPLVRKILPPHSDRYFEVQAQPDGTLSTRGVVVSGLVVVAERTLVVPAGRPSREYIDQSR